MNVCQAITEKRQHKIKQLPRVATKITTIQHIPVKQPQYTQILEVAPINNCSNSIRQYLEYLQSTLKGLACFRLDILLPTPGKKLESPPSPGRLP